MENPHDPALWTQRQWLAFLLMIAADADGQMDASEMRPINVGLGNEVVASMLDWVQGLSNAEREGILRDSLAQFVQQRGAREKLQRLLRDTFMADGEYSTAEQALTRKIGDWIRAASAD